MAAATVDPDKILSQRQLAEINRALAAVDKARSECELAEKCGNDMCNQYDEIEEIRQALNMYKKTYFPDAK